MRVAVSWLREYVELPADLTAEQLDLALTNLGIEVESIVDEGASVQGTLAVGQVLTVELSGFKPIRFCRRRRPRLRHGRGAGDRLRLDPIARGRSGRRDPARWRASGRVHHRGAQDLRAQLSRDDLLRPRARRE
jgi:hypothetical protein